MIDRIIRHESRAHRIALALGALLASAALLAPAAALAGGFHDPGLRHSVHDARSRVVAPAHRGRAAFRGFRPEAHRRGEWVAERAGHRRHEERRGRDDRFDRTRRWHGDRFAPRDEGSRHRFERRGADRDARLWRRAPAARFQVTWAWPFPH